MIELLVLFASVLQFHQFSIFEFFSALPIDDSYLRAKVKVIFGSNWVKVHFKPVKTGENTKFPSLTLCFRWNSRSSFRFKSQMMITIKMKTKNPVASPPMINLKFAWSSPITSPVVNMTEKSPVNFDGGLSWKLWRGGHKIVHFVCERFVCASRS